MDSRRIIANCLNTLLVKMEHLHLTKFDYENLSLSVSSAQFLEKLMKHYKKSNMLTARDQRCPSP